MTLSVVSFIISNAYEIRILYNLFYFSYIYYYYYLNIYKYILFIINNIYILNINIKNNNIIIFFLNIYKYMLFIIFINNINIKQ